MMTIDDAAIKALPWVGRYLNEAQCSCALWGVLQALSEKELIELKQAHDASNHGGVRE